VSCAGSAPAAPAAGVVLARVDSAGPARPRRRLVIPRPSAVEHAPIASVDVRPGNVYDVSGARTVLSPFRRLANRLHVRTRPATIRNELLFAAGDPWSEHIAQETTRNLRALDYLVPQRIEARRRGDSVAVVVATSDLWTTSPEVNLETVGGTRTGSWGLTERNLLGLGKSLALLYRQGETGVSRSLSYDDPNLTGRHDRLRLSVGKSTEGASRRLQFGRPFYAEETSHAWSLGAEATTSVAHLYQAGSEVASFDQRIGSVTLTRGWRLPARFSPGGAITRLTASYEQSDRRYGPSRLSPGAPVEFAGGEQSDRRRMMAAELRFWAPRFAELEDVDRMDRVQDLDLGTSLRLKAGFAPRFLGSTVDEGYGRVRLEKGTDSGFGFGWLGAGLETRLRPDPSDEMGQLEGRWYVAGTRHTLVLAALGMAGGRVSRPFQLVVGGLNGLRAFDAQALAGRRLWRFNAEDRRSFTPQDWQLFRAALAVFYDAARAWGPGADGAGWFQDTGLGLRLGFPQLGLAQVIRADVAWPIEPTIGGRRRPVISLGSSQAF
jgi:hypothetical protein